LGLFGFVWVCFFELESLLSFHNPMFIRHLHSFSSIEIGFVLHKGLEFSAASGFIAAFSICGAWKPLKLGLIGFVFQGPMPGYIAIIHY
jgi:hypothetical protein